MLHNIAYQSCFCRTILPVDSVAHKRAPSVAQIPPLAAYPLACLQTGYSALSWFMYGKTSERLRVIFILEKVQYHSLENDLLFASAQEI